MILSSLRLWLPDTCSIQEKKKRFKLKNAFSTVLNHGLIEAYSTECEEMHRGGRRGLRREVELLGWQGPLSDWVGLWIVQTQE